MLLFYLPHPTCHAKIAAHTIWTMQYNSNTDELAQALANEFYRRQAERTGKTVRNYREHREDPLWRRVAALVQQLHATPENFIRAQFETAHGHLFSSALSGEVAKKRYLRWKEQQLIGTPTQVEDDQLDAAMLNTRIADTYASLLYYCGSVDLTDPVVARKVLEIYLHWDPVVMLMLNPTPRFKEVFGAFAKKQLEESPGLRQAVEELGFGMVLDYLEDDDEKEVQP